MTDYTGSNTPADKGDLWCTPPALFTALNRDTMELHTELVPFDARLAQEMSDRAVTVVQASEAGDWLPRAAIEPTAVVCRGGMAGGKWHAPCAWAAKCWGERR